MKIISDEFPLILFENYVIPTKEEKDFIISDIVSRKENYNDNNFGANNVEVVCDYNNFLKKLYEKYVETCRQILNPFTIHESNIDMPWTYCTNQYDHIHAWHNHMKSSTINCVYYLQIPNCEGGQLEIEYDGKRLDFYPKEYDLIIFPNFLDHAPRRPYCDEYRISINLEIRCNEPSKYIFANFLN